MQVLDLARPFDVGQVAPQLLRRRENPCLQRARERHGHEAAHAASVIVSRIEVAPRQIQRVVGGREAHALAPAREQLGRRARRARPAHREADRADRLVGGAAVRAGDAGDRHRHRRAAHPLRPLRHLARRRLADRAEVGDGLGLDAQHADLHLVVVGDDAAPEEGAGSPTRVVTSSPAQPAGARLGDRQRGLLRLQRLGHRLRKRLAVDAVDAGADALAQLGLDLLEDLASPRPSASRRTTSLTWLTGFDGPEVQRRAVDAGQDAGQAVVDVRFAHPVQVPGARDRTRPAQLAPAGARGAASPRP